MGGSVTQFSIEPPDQGATKFEVEAPPSDAPPTPGFFKQLVAPYNPGAEDLNPVLRTLDAAGGALLSTPGAIYHAFADQPTEEEKKKFGEEETKGLKRVGLGVHRLVVDPVASAASYYASGKVTPRAALSVLPEAIGVGIGAQAAGELGGRTLSKVGELRQKFGTDSGLQQFSRRATQIEPAAQEAVKKAGIKQEEALAKTAEGQETFKERAGLAKTVDESSVKLGKQIEQVEAGAAKEANAKFSAVREKLGISKDNPGPEVPPDNLVKTVRNIESQTLQDIPENVKEFRAIYAHGEEATAENAAKFKETTGEDPLGGKPFTWDKLQALKSRLDARLRGPGARRMNGLLRMGIRQLRDSVVGEMGAIAEPGGAGELWADAKNFYRNFKEDFHEPQGPSGSGSPVAAAFDALDPKNIRQPFVAKQSTVGNRGVDILRKYPQHGGTEAAATAEEMLGHHENLRRMPDKAMPKPPAAPTVDIHKVALDQIASKAKNWGSFNARDVGILGSSVLAGTFMHLLGGKGLELPIAALSYEGLKYGASRALNNPRVIEWLAKTPAEEVAVLKKIPGADKVKIVDGLTRAAIQSGKPIRLSPLAADFIGPANAARIMGATGSVAATRVQNRKDALNLLTPP